MKQLTKCHSCQKWKRPHRRGICHGCYQSRRVRERYGRGTGQYKRKVVAESMADVENLIAEVLAEGLPDWWDKKPTLEPQSIPKRVLRQYPRGHRVEKKKSH